jgi:hypothetical protein
MASYWLLPVKLTTNKQTHSRYATFYHHYWKLHENLLLGAKLLPTEHNTMPKLFSQCCELHEKRHSRILTSFGVWSSFILCPSNKNRSELRATPCHKVYVVYIYFWWRKCFSEKAIKCVWSKRLQSFKRMLFNFSYLTYLSITESLL